jgi:hypothetical protein
VSINEKIEFYNEILELNVKQLDYFCFYFYLCDERLHLKNPN